MSLLGELTYALIRPSSRAIGTIIPDVVIEEAHRDELIITQHPVEKGAAITDHAFKRPSEVDMRCGFSNSSAGAEGYAQEVYQSLLALQATRRPFSIYTGKRAYRNMLIRGLAVTTEARSENALMVVVSLQEIIITSTKTTGTGTDTTTTGAIGDQGAKDSTGQTVNLGDQQATGVGDTAFAGSFNPGQTSTTGDPLGSPGIGSGVGLGTGDLPGFGNGAPGLDGIAPPFEVTLPEISTGSTPSVSGLAASGPDQYNLFGGGP